MSCYILYHVRYWRSIQCFTLTKFFVKFLPALTPILYTQKMHRVYYTQCCLSPKSQYTQCICSFCGQNTSYLHTPPTECHTCTYMYPRSSLLHAPRVCTLVPPCCQGFWVLPCLSYLKAKIHPLQDGFRSVFSCLHFAFILQEAISSIWKEDGACSLFNVRKASDTVWHAELMVKLRFLYTSDTF